MKKKGSLFIWVIAGAVAALVYFGIKKQKADKALADANNPESDTQNNQQRVQKYPAKEKGFFEFTPYQWFGYDIRNLF